MVAGNNMAAVIAVEVAAAETVEVTAVTEVEEIAEAVNHVDIKVAEIATEMVAGNHVADKNAAEIPEMVAVETEEATGAVTMVAEEVATEVGAEMVIGVETTVLTMVEKVKESLTTEGQTKANTTNQVTDHQAQKNLEMTRKTNIRRVLSVKEIPPKVAQKARVNPNTKTNVMPSSRTVHLVAENPNQGVAEITMIEI